MLEIATRFFGEKLFQRRKLMDAAEAEVRRLGLWTDDDDVLAKSVGIKSRGLAAIDFRFSDLVRTGSLISEKRNTWRVATSEVERIRAKLTARSSGTSHTVEQSLGEPEVLLALRPQSKRLVYDLVTQAGVNTADWANYRRPEAPASNPKYCYNWSFEGPDRVVVCLWFEEMKQEGKVVFQSLNYREIAASRQRWNPTQRKRAAEMDHAIQLARLKRLPVRVIVVDGSMRSDAEDETRSHVERRMLDPVPWHVASYDDDGNCRLQRGLVSALFVDQFSLPATGAPERRQAVVVTFARNPEVRARVLARSGGVCESCRAPGFLLPDGRCFLETHHIIPLSENGSDNETNVIAICPNEHREAHYGAKAPELRTRFTEIVRSKMTRGGQTTDFDIG